MANQERRDRAGAEYRASLKTPIWMLGTGVAGATITYGLSYGWIPALGLDVFLLFKVGVAVAVFWVLSILWLGQSEHFGGLLLKVAGIYASLEFAGALFDLVPVLDGFLGWVILGLAYIGLLQHLLDLEPREAIGVALITFIVRTFTIIFLVGFFFSAI